MQLKRLSEELPKSYKYTVFIYEPYSYDVTKTKLVQGYSSIGNDEFTIMAIRIDNSTIDNKITHISYQFLEVPKEQKQDIYWIYLEDLKKLWSNEDVCKTK